MTTNSIESIVDLWPDDLEVTDLVPPVTILKQQAVLLGKKTKNLLEGQVATFSDASGLMGGFGGGMGGTPRGIANASVPAQGFVNANTSTQTTFYHTFDLVASTLNGYKYTLFSASHNISMYPISITFNGQRRDCNTEQEFLQALRDIFNSDETRRIISALVAQSKA